LLEDCLDDMATRQLLQVISHQLEADPNNAVTSLSAGSYINGTPQQSSQQPSPQSHTPPSVYSH
jgi:hypothetical protein